MGNALWRPCFSSKEWSSNSVKLIFWEGTIKTLTGRDHIAGEIMFEFPDKMVCHADSFFLGRPVPSLAIDDYLVPGETYFVLPIDLFPAANFSNLSASSLTALAAASSSPKRGPMDFGESGPFEYVKGRDGRVLAKVSPDFIIRNIISRSGRISNGGDNKLGDNYDKPIDSMLCSTPELKKRYEQLCGSREQVWSPNLETISEHKVRFSPRRFIGLELLSRNKSN